MAEVRQSDVRNRLLAVMAADDFLLLQPHLDAAAFELRERPFKAQQVITHVAFLETAIASIVADHKGGRFEVATVGREGLTGVPVVLGIDRSPYTCLVRVAGTALRIEADKLRAAMDQSSTLHSLLLRFAHTFIIQISQTAYANAGSSIEERIARWLLMTRDRLDQDEMPVTHEFMSVMLGTRRPGVTLAIQMLESVGVIKATRGRITVIDRGKLEQIAGQAYGVAEKEYSNIFQFPIERER